MSAFSLSRSYSPFAPGGRCTRCPITPKRNRATSSERFITSSVTVSLLWLAPGSGQPTELPRTGRRGRPRFLLEGGGRGPPPRRPGAETERRRQRAEVRPQLEAKADQGHLGAQGRADGHHGG